MYGKIINILLIYVFICNFSHRYANMKPNKHCLKTCYKINISKSINQLQKYIFFNQSTLEITYCERIDKQAVECSTLGTHFLVVFANYLTLLTNLKVVITQSSCSLHVVCSFLFFWFYYVCGY